MIEPCPTSVAELREVRQAVYSFLLAAFDRPGPEQHAWIASDEFRQTLRQLCFAFDIALPPAPLAADSAADHEARYIACFDVGLPHPPVPLLASHYNHREPVPATIHEHILFYRRFGACLAKGEHDPADHLRGELAFLLHLDTLLANGQIDEASILYARRDFLTRQVHRWVGQAAAAAETNGLPPLYRTLLALLAAAVEQDLDMTTAAVAALPPEGA